MSSGQLKTRPAKKAAKLALQLPVVDGHPNRLAFEGVLTLLDTPSDRSPTGARGHRVILTRAAAETALPSLMGMAVDYKIGWDGHDNRQKCGIITHAEISGDRVLVGGFVFAKDFPEIEQRLRLPGDADGVMGMSYELADAHVADMRAEIWTLTRATFVGAAILLRDRAAYTGTRFRLTGSTKKPAAKTVELGARRNRWMYT